MKFDKNIEAFIMMRIEGKSFDEIAIALKTSKQTLIDWNKQVKVRDNIQEGKAIKLNSIVKAYKFDVQNRLDAYLQLSNKIKDELLSRDLSDVPADKLLQMSIANDGRIKETIKGNIMIGRQWGLITVGEDEDGYFMMQVDE